MKKCFVIQPFDNGKFDKRYDDVFEPAIREANLNPYRVDKDPSSRILIENIETNIRESAICFAEITTDNPNVWYELGYASACGKDIVMVCNSEERNGKFPFDIQHKHIINYSTGSLSDFTLLKSSIIEKVKALLSNSKAVEKLSSSVLMDTEGLEGHEIAMMLIIMENQLTSYDSISVFQLREYMTKAGYTEIATSVSIRTLSRKKLVQVVKEQSFDAMYVTYCCRLTNEGETWILENQDKFKFRRETGKTKLANGNEDNPDVTF